MLESESRIAQGMSSFNLPRIILSKSLRNGFKQLRTCRQHKCTNRPSVSLLNHCAKFGTCQTVFGTRVRRKPPPFIPMANRIVVPPLTEVKPQFYDYFLVLDFEATCEEGKQIEPQEIIEFPVLKVNAITLEIEATFHQYVQPRVNKELSKFCIELTGIIQEMVDDQPHLEETLQKFDKWLRENGLLDPEMNFLFVTCGDWDLMKMLPKQCRHFNIAVPPYMREWLNIKKAFSEVTTAFPKGMMPMLENLGIPHQGRHHSGIDDCKNIAHILMALLQRGYVAKASGRK